MRVADVVYSLLSLLVLGASSAHAIDVGDVFWLSSSGTGLTVIGTALAQPGVVRIQYRILPENASEFCQRYEQHARLTPQHEKCVAGIINNTPQRTALVNCSARVIVLESGSFAKGGDHFWRSRTDPSSFVLGDDLFARSCTPAAGSPPLGAPNTASIAPPGAPPPGAASNSYSIGPSFDCGTKAVSEQPLAQMICASRELAYRELSYVIAYQALKEPSSADQRKTMVAEANALVVAMNYRCNLPATGALRRSPTEQEVGCIGALFQQERAALIERTAGVARDEAVLEPVDTLAIQKALQAQAYISRSDALDGVFGPVTRKAISAWQRDNGVRETGFGSKALIDQLAAVASRGQAAPATPPSPAPPVASSEPRERSPAVDRSGKTNAIRLTLGEGPDLRPQDVFEKVSGAVYVVQTQDSLGSAVAISERELLTNCHVVGNNAFVSLEREGVRLRVAVVSANADADRCVLSVGTAAEPLPKWVRVRPYADVKVGERAFTVGAPQGLELSLAEGIISSKRAVDAGRLFQTSAPISKGSSGGGLFDAHGNLLGVTTFMLKDAQNLNFAIAAEEYAK
jgi:peptidoglycan hydrolase-like protein with peptidoglycan-binding domain